MIPSISHSEPSRINPLGVQLSAIQRRERWLMCCIDSIGTEMRENVAIIAEVVEAKLAIIRGLISCPQENRDFKEAENQFKIQLNKIERENVECYQNLLDARDSYMQSGRQIMLTKEKKHELIFSFADSIQRRLSQTCFSVDALTDLKQLKKSIKKEMETQLCLHGNLLESKTSLTMEFEKTAHAADQIKEAKIKLYCQEPADIWQASEMGNLDFLKKKIDELWFWEVEDFVNQKNSDGQTLLALTSAHGHLNCVQLLLDNKANPNIPDNNGYCPLHWSAGKGYIEICGKLIQYKAHVDARGEYQRTPLNMAAYNGHAETCAFLLKKGANINAQTNIADRELSILHVAVMMERSLVVILLTKNPRLNVNLLDSKKHSPLYYAVRTGCSETAALIMTHPNWKCPKDPNDPNHMSQLSRLTPSKNSEQIDKFFGHYL